jgi:hypothetical protein
MGGGGAVVAAALAVAAEAIKLLSVIKVLGLCGFETTWGWVGLYATIVTVE